MITPAVRPGPRNAITDVDGIKVGHHQRTGRGWLTGTTVVIPPVDTVGGVDVRGGGPGTRETELLHPENMVQRVDAICLSGGSAYGLAAATGVVDWLAERGRGLPIGSHPEAIVPIVPAAVLFDLGLGGRFDARPDATFGYRAANVARGGVVKQGGVGAGTGAHAGGLKGGMGTASAVLDNGITVAALVAANPGGSPVDPRTGELWGARYGLEGEFDHLRRPRAAEARSFRDAPPTRPALNTTLAVLATDARLDNAECQRLAMAGHDGMARSVSPIHMYTDGDVVFSLATGAVEVPDVRHDGGVIRPEHTRVGQLGLLFAAGADCVARAIVHAVLAATSAGGLDSYLARFPSATRQRTGS
ncbi:MAG: P1 family peptidase [Desertimonas sp.]